MTNPYESYYLTKHSELNAKTRKLLKQRGWKREVADVLLKEEGSSDENAVAAIYHILTTVQSPSRDENGVKRNKFLIGLLPKNIQGKANMLMHYVTKVVRITEEGLVQYDDGSYGSNIIDLLKYFCASGNLRSQKPFDADKIGKLLKEVGAPDSAFGSAARKTLTTPLTQQWKSRY